MTTLVDQLAANPAVAGANGDVAVVIRAGEYKFVTLGGMAFKAYPSGGTDGQVLGLVSGALGWITPAGGGGSYRAKDYHYNRNTFGDIGTFNSSATGRLDGWSYYCSGTGASVAGAVAGTTYDAGDGYLSTGTTNAGQSVVQDSVSVRPDYITTLELYARLGLGQASTSGQRFLVWVGFQPNQTPPGTGTANGIGFRYSDNINGGNWQAYVGNGAANTVADTGVAPSVDPTQQRFKITWAGGTANVLFFINDVQVASIAKTNMDMTTAIFASHGILKTVGTTACTTVIDDLEVLVGRKYTG